MAELFNKVWEDIKVDKKSATSQGAAVPNGISTEDIAENLLKVACDAAKLKLLDRLLERLTEGGPFVDKPSDEAQRETGNGAEKPSGNASDKTVRQQAGCPILRYCKLNSNPEAPQAPTDQSRRLQRRAPVHLVRAR